MHQPFSGRQGEESAHSTLPLVFGLLLDPSMLFPEDTEGQGEGWEFRKQREASDSAPSLLRSQFSHIKHELGRILDLLGTNVVSRELRTWRGPLRMQRASPSLWHGGKSWGCLHSLH